MQNIASKAKNYKRAVIRSFAPFLNSGLITASEIEFIANGAVTKAVVERSL